MILGEARPGGPAGGAGGGQPPPWEGASRLGVVGAGVPRRTAYEKVTGRARFTFDVRLPGMLFGWIARSRIARGRVVSIDVRKAERVPGVRLILTPESFPPFPGVSRASSYRPISRTAIAAEVRFVGEEIAAVAADTEDAAEEAARLLEVRYEAWPAVLDPEEAMRPHAPRLTPGGNVPEGGVEVYERGDVRAGEAAADVVLERRYSTSAQHHNPLEPHCCVAIWQDGGLTVWDSNQGVHAVRDGLCRSLGLPTNRVRVLTEHVGGGFGSKNGLKPYQVLAAVLSRRTGRPVRVAMSRRDEFVASHHRAPTRRVIRGGARRDGTLTFIHHTAVGQAGPDPEMSGPAAAADQTRLLHLCPNLRTETTAALTNVQNPIVFRGPTAAEDLFCFEQFVDELAHAAGVDPLAFRLKNLAGRDQVEGRPYASDGLKACYERGAEAFGWRWRPPGSAGDGDRRRGIGLGALWSADQQTEQSQAIVILQPDGTAEVMAGVSEFGCGTETVLAQIAAEALGLRLEHVAVSIGDSRLPYTINSSYGSRTVSLAGPAVRAAAFEARRRLLALAGEALGADPGALAVEDEQVVSRDDPGRRLPVKDVAARMGRELIVGVGNRRPDDTAALSAGGGAHFVEVEVDAATGQVRVLRAVCAHDAGRWINPLLAESQVQGGFIQGMGMALFEEGIRDGRTGAQLNDTMLAYRTPTIADAPDRIVVVRVSAMDATNGVGAKGLGEPPLYGAGAAIANAVHNAIGVRVRDYPITPDKVLAALKQGAPSPRGGSA